MRIDDVGDVAAHVERLRVAKERTHLVQRRVQVGKDVVDVCDARLTARRRAEHADDRNLRVVDVVGELEERAEG
jgi:hypothetical protein